MKMKYAFTMVEILIVVVIMGILAAIVIPQFSSASSQARETYLTESLENLRTKVRIYQAEHNGLLPGQEGTSAAHITRQTSSQRFADALLNRTNENGQIGVSSKHRFGPYLECLPANPFVTRNADRIEIDGEAGNGDHGWHLTTKGRKAGHIAPDDAGINPFTNVTHVDY